MRGTAHASYDCHAVTLGKVRAQMHQLQWSGSELTAAGCVYCKINLRRRLPNHDRNEETNPNRDHFVMGA